jgi:hypothetical protein
MHYRTITSLAILKVNWDSKKEDYIENFVPFIVNLVAKKNYSVIDLTVLRDDFKDEYGLVLPLAPLTVILKRATKRGYFIKKDHEFFPVSSKITEGNFSSLSATQDRNLNQVIKEFQDFVKTKFDITIPEKEAESCILEFVKNEDLNIIFGVNEDEKIIPEPKDQLSSSGRDKFLVAKFLQWASRENNTIFQLITDLTVGQMLAYTILNPDIQNYQGRLKGQNFYLDIAFLFSILGIDGPETQAVYGEIVDALNEAEANLLVFQHTFNEFIKILESDLNFLNKNLLPATKINRSLESFIFYEKTPSDVESLINNAEGLLNKKKIFIKDSSNYTKESDPHQIDEKELKKTIVKKYKERDHFFNEQEKDYTIQKDIDSISGIERLRKGKYPKTLQAASHTLITGNPSLAAACSVFANRDGHFTIPPCLHHLFLGTLLFLEMPTRVTKINERKLLADAYAAMRPSEELLKKYWSLIQDLQKKGDITTDEYVLLKSGRVARNILQEKTLGVLKNLDTRTPKLILSEIQTKAQEDIKKNLVQEKIKHIETQEKLTKSLTKEAGLEERVMSLNASVALIVSWTIYVIAIITLVFYTIASDTLLKKVLFGILSIVTYSTGFHLLYIKNKLHNFIVNLLNDLFFPN